MAEYHFCQLGAVQVVRLSGQGAVGPLHRSDTLLDSFPGSRTAASHWNDEFSVSDNKNLQRSRW